MNKVKKKMDKENKKRVAIALWRANVPLKEIRGQTKIPERTLRRILANMRGGEGEEGAVNGRSPVPSQSGRVHAPSPPGRA